MVRLIRWFKRLNAGMDEIAKIEASVSRMEKMHK